MRKALSLLLFLVLNLTAIVPAFAQKARLARPFKQLATAVETTMFGDVAGYTDGSGVWLTWQMKVEKNNLGFQVYRYNGKDRELVSYGEFIKGAEPMNGSDVVRGEVYDFFDEKGSADSQYVIVGLTVGGDMVESAPFYPTYVWDLNSLSGFRQRDPVRRHTTNGLLEGTELIVEDKELKAEIESYQLTPDPVSHRTVISTPGSVRIGVRTAGPTRVTRAELQSAGFNVNGDTSTWQLFTEGNEQAITIGPNADYIEFLGKGVDTLESDMRMYYLIQGVGTGKRIGTRVVRPIFNTVVAPNAPQTLVKKERTTYFPNILNGPENNYWGTAITSSPTAANATFNLTGIDLNAPTATISLRIQGYSHSLHNVSVTLNGQVLSPMTGAGPVVMTANYVVPTASLVEGTNTLQLKENVSGAFSFFDTVTASYSRKFTALQDQLTFAAPSFKNVQLDGFSSANIRVFDVTNENEPLLVMNLNPQATGPSFGVKISNGRPRVYYAANDSTIRSAAYVGANDPALLTNPGQGAHFIVITHPSLQTQADTWAAYRASASVTSRVVNVDEIFDEFNYGVSNADSIEAFLQYANTNWTPAPQYVLLMGDGSYDPRNYENRGYFNMVPSKFIDSIFQEMPSDEALADFNNDGLAEIQIGRIAARTGSVASTMFEKTQQWEASNNTSRGSLCAADLLDVPNGYNFEDMCAQIVAQLPVGMPNLMAPRSTPNARENLLAGLNSAKYIVNYSGHGSPGLWASTSFFSVLDVPSLTPSTQPTIYTMLTCLNGYFVAPGNDSLAELLAHAPGKGAVATWSSSGRTTPDVQLAMAKRFYLDIGTFPATSRIGDLIKDAKNHVAGGTDVRLSWVLLGDPMLRMHPDPPPFAKQEKGR